MINTFTASLRPLDNLTNSSDYIIAQMKTLYPKINQIGAPGFAYAF
jgi:hypothetical protein